MQLNFSFTLISPLLGLSTILPPVRTRGRSPPAPRRSSSPTASDTRFDFSVVSIGKGGRPSRVLRECWHPPFPLPAPPGRNVISGWKGFPKERDGSFAVSHTFLRRLDAETVDASNCLLFSIDFVLSSLHSTRSRRDVLRMGDTASEGMRCISCALPTLAIQKVSRNHARSLRDRLRKSSESSCKSLDHSCPFRIRTLKSGRAIRKQITTRRIGRTARRGAFYKNIKRILVPGKHFARRELSWNKIRLR